MITKAHFLKQQNHYSTNVLETRVESAFGVPNFSEKINSKNLPRKTSMQIHCVTKINLPNGLIPHVNLTVFI